MHSFEAESTIAATPDEVWKVLPDWGNSECHAGPSFQQFADGLKRRVEGA